MCLFPRNKIDKKRAQVPNDGAYANSVYEWLMLNHANNDKK